MPHPKISNSLCYATESPLNSFRQADLQRKRRKDMVYSRLWAKVRADLQAKDACSRVVASALMRLLVSTGSTPGPPGIAVSAATATAVSSVTTTAAPVTSAATPVVTALTLVAASVSLDLVETVVRVGGCSGSNGLTQ